jgi:hypothetical protein
VTHFALRTKFAETKLVLLTFHFLGVMSEITVVVRTFSESRPLSTFGHSGKIILMKKVTFITLHTQIPEPMPTNNRMAAARPENTSRHASQATCFLHKLTLTPSILRPEVRFEIEVVIVLV